VIVVLALGACDEYHRWPDEGTAFPDVYTPQTDLEPYEEVRWETETWDPTTDFTMAGLYLLKAQNHRKSAPVEELAHFDAMRAELPPLASTGLRLSFVGDVMWVGDGWSDFLVPASGLLDGDVRVGNLETPVSPDDSTDPSDLDLYEFNAPTAILDALPFDVVQATNNHALDVGNSGLEATLAQLDAHGYTEVGIDTPPVMDVSGQKVVFLAYTWGVNRPETPTTHDLHVIPFGHLDEPIDLSGLASDVAEARANADIVVVMVHWGYEYEYYADPHFLVLGRQIIGTGADLIVGEGPHVVQPPEYCQVNDPSVVPGVGTCSLRTDDEVPRTAAILYSLGDFGTNMPTVPCQVGIVATVSFDGRDVSGLGWAPAVATIEGGVHTEHPLADRMDDPELAAESARLDAHLGTRWKR
jgi:hypothetical protein